MTSIHNTALADTLNALFNFPLFKGLELQLGDNASNGLRILDAAGQPTLITHPQVRLINRALRPFRYHVEVVGSGHNAKFISK
jgi:hypothetical protein